MRCEARTLDDIRALGGNDAADERRFATAARVSEINLALYRTFVQPIVRALVDPGTRRVAAAAASAAAAVRIAFQRQSDDGTCRATGRPSSRGATPAAADNPFVALQESASRQIVAALDAWRDLIEVACRANFPDGLRLADAPGGGRHRPGRHAPAAKGAQESAASRTPARSGSPNSKSAFRPVGCATPSFAADLCGHGARRGRRARVRSRPPHAQMLIADLSLAEFKALVREQFNMLLIDQEAALAAIPSMLPPDAETRAEAFDLIKQVLSATRHVLRRGQGEAARRSAACSASATAALRTPFRQTREDRQAKAS